MIRVNDMNLVDILILGFILLGAFHGYQKGLISGILNFLSYVVGLIIAFWKYVYVLRWVEQYFPLQQWLEPIIYKAILPYVQSKAPAIPIQEPDGFFRELPLELRGLFDNLSDLQFSLAIEQVTHRLAGIITELILGFIAFCGVFFMVVIVVRLFLSIIFQPYGGWCGPINRAGGLFVGGLSALIGMSILAGLFSLFLQFGLSGSMNSIMQSSLMYPYLLEIFEVMDQVFFAQISQKLLEPLSPLSPAQGLRF